MATPPPALRDEQIPLESPQLPLELIDRDALEVVRRLRRYGHTAYLVGGCVRDLSLGIKPKDFDVATSARPEEIRSVFRNCRIIGRRFRLAHVYFRGGKIIEASTFRALAGEVEEPPTAAPQDLLIRHDNVFGSEEEDARRRDFTVNGLFFDVATGRVIDHVGGLADLKARCVRMIGNPDIRLREDPVRILRAARIAAKVGLAIDPELLAAMGRHKHEITRCAKARVLEETFKLLRTGHAERSVRILEETGALEVVLPETHAHIQSCSAEGHSPEIYAFLKALDARIGRGPVTDTVVLGALIMPPLAELEARVEPHLRPQLEAEHLFRVCERLGVTRRMGERLRQILLAQKHFIPPSKRGRRKVAPASLMRRNYFDEALDLFEINVVALEQPGEELRFWRDRGRAPRPTAELSDLNGPDSGPEPIDAGPRNRRGSRRRRRNVAPSAGAESIESESVELRADEPNVAPLPPSST